MKYWEHSTESQLLELSVPFLGTWQTSGTMLDGQVYELVMPAHPISDSESLSLPTPTTQDNSGTCRDHGGDLLHELICGCPRVDRKNLELLRTPVASEAEGGAVAPDVAKANGQTLRLSGQMIDMVAPEQLPKLPTPTVSDQYTANLASTQQKEGSMHSVTLAQVFHKPDLFPTPVAVDWKNGRPSQGWGTNLPGVAADLMPTPKALDGIKGNLKTSQERIDSGHQVDLPNVAIDLLGTPRATAANSSSKQVELGAPKARIEDQVKLFNTPTTMDAKATNNPEIAQKFLDQGRQTCLTYDVATNWGKFEPAIRRWEAIIGRPAPEPTKPDGKEGNHRLSSKFTEWMMGLPDGWITDIGLKRNDELKACGNGVVPQQAELALSLLGINEILEAKLPERKET
jgi:hypothetical protein